MKLANTFIIDEKVMSTFPSGIKDGIAKTQKNFKKMVAVELIGDFSSRKHLPFNTKQYRGQRRHRIDYVNSHGLCKRCYKEEKRDSKVFMKCSDCGVYLCLTKTETVGSSFTNNNGSNCFPFLFFFEQTAFLSYCAMLM